MNSMTYDEMISHQRNVAALRLFKFAETCLFIFLIFFYSGAFVGLVFPHPDSIEMVDNPFARLLWYPVYGLVLLLALRSLPQVIRAALDKTHSLHDSIIGEAKEIAFFPPMTGG